VYSSQQFISSWQVYTFKPEYNLFHSTYEVLNVYAAKQAWNRCYTWWAKIYLWNERCSIKCANTRSCKRLELFINLLVLVSCKPQLPPWLSITPWRHRIIFFAFRTSSALHLNFSYTSIYIWSSIFVIKHKVQITFDSKQSQHWQHY
jgi:hypothetical protein